MGVDVETFERVFSVRGIDLESFVKERELLLDRGQLLIGIFCASG